MTKTTKVKISEEILETLYILENLRKLKGILDCTKYHNLEQLAIRCDTKNYALFADILVNLGAGIIEDS